MREVSFNCGCLEALLRCDFRYGFPRFMELVTDEFRVQLRRFRRRWIGCDLLLSTVLLNNADKGRTKAFEFAAADAFYLF